MLIKEMLESEKPRERLIKHGTESLSNTELIAIILRTGTKEMSVMELSNQVIKKINNINELKNLSINDLCQIKGLKEIKAITLIAALELGKRVYTNNIIEPKILMNSTTLVYKTFSNLIENELQENFLAIYLDTKKQLIDYKIISVGTVDQSIAHPRDLFREAYRLAASSIVIMHNHPSGVVNPSISDIELTKQLKKISEVMDIPILDHIIVGNNKYFSFLDNGLI